MVQSEDSNDKIYCDSFYWESYFTPVHEASELDHFLTTFSVPIMETDVKRDCFTTEIMASDIV